MHLRFDPNSGLTPHVKCADAFGTIHFVGRHGEQVDLHGFHVQRDLACTLSSINVIEHTSGPAHFTDTRNVVNHANFIIRMHHRNQNRVLTKSGRDHIRRSEACFVGRQIRYLIPFAFELTAGIKHRFVLDL